MDSKQLALLLSLYSTIIDDAIADAEKKLPDEAKEEYKNILGGTYRQVPAFSKLYNLQGKITEDIEKLEKE